MKQLRSDDGKKLCSEVIEQTKNVSKWIRSVVPKQNEWRFQTIEV